MDGMLRQWQALPFARQEAAPVAGGEVHSSAHRVGAKASLGRGQLHEQLIATWSLAVSRIHCQHLSAGVGGHQRSSQLPLPSSNMRAPARWPAGSHAATRRRLLAVDHTVTPAGSVAQVGLEHGPASALETCHDAPRHPSCRPACLDRAALNPQRACWGCTC